MTRYSVQPRDQIFVKGYGFFSFAKNMGRNIGKNISKNLSSKYSQKLINHAKQSATDALETGSRRAIQKTAEATNDLIWNTIADKITRVSKTSPKNNWETVTNEEEILRERYISPQLRHKVINDLRLKQWYIICNNGISKNNKIIRQYTKQTI